MFSSLQLAAVIYEHENDRIREAVNFWTPGQIWRWFTGNSKGDEVDAAEYNGDVEIHKFCAQFEIEYEPISGACRCPSPLMRVEIYIYIGKFI